MKGKRERIHKLKFANQIHVKGGSENLQAKLLKFKALRYW